MQRHHTGSGRRTVIPDDWSEHHRGVVDSTHTATVTLRRPGGTRGAFDDAAGSWSTTPNAAYYTGAARIQALLVRSVPNAEAAEQEVTTLRYSVMLDSAVDSVQINDLVRVTAVTDNGDDSLIGRDLTVEAVARGSLHWERRLVCSDSLNTP